MKRAMRAMRVTPICTVYARSVSRFSMDRPLLVKRSPSSAIREGLPGRGGVKDAALPPAGPGVDFAGSVMGSAEAASANFGDELDFDAGPHRDLRDPEGA